MDSSEFPLAKSVLVIITDKLTALLQTPAMIHSAQPNNS